MGTKPTVRIVDVTPAKARKMLASNFRNNRPMNEHRVLAYAEDMTNGHWVFTGESIGFDVNGDLVNGQHRLAAVVKSGATVQMLVVTGLDRKAMVNMDTQMGRRLSHVLALQSYDNPSELAATLSAANVYEAYMEDKVDYNSATIITGIDYRPAAGKRPYRRFSQQAFTRSRALQLLERRPTLIDSVAAMKPHCHTRKTQIVRPSPAIASLIHNIAATVGEGAAAIEYVEAVRSGAGDVSDPAWQTHQILARDAAAKSITDKMLPYTKYAAWFRGYEAYSEGDTGKLRKPKMRSYPTIPGDVEWYLAGKEES